MPKVDSKYMEANGLKEIYTFGCVVDFNLMTYFGCVAVTCLSLTVYGEISLPHPIMHSVLHYTCANVWHQGKYDETSANIELTFTVVIISLSVARIKRNIGM